MLSNRPSQFDYALQDMVAAIGGRNLAPVLGIGQTYLNRMANPHDTGAHFRARDLLPTMRHGLAILPADTALAPLRIICHSLGLAVYPLPQAAGASSLVHSLSRAARRFGQLGERGICAVDPTSPGGRIITATELGRIQRSGYCLAGHVANVIAQARAIHRGA